MTDEPVTEFFEDAHGNECYRVSLGQLTTYVSSGHLVPDGIARLKRKLNKENPPKN
jgi:hypothetical protein